MLVLPICTICLRRTILIWLGPAVYVRGISREVLLVELVVEGNADIEEGIDGEVGAGNGQFLIMCVHFQKVEQRLYFAVSTGKFCNLHKQYLPMTSARPIFHLW